MAKIIKNKLGNFLVICLIFLIVTVWVFSGWPRIWKKPAFPPKIQEAYALTATKTFTFETTAESWVANDRTKSTLSHDAGTGNPQGALKAQTTTKIANSSGYWEWTGTWEDLGVPEGSTVTQIRVNAGYTRCTAYTLGDPSSVGPYEIWDNTPALMATLWGGRPITGTDAVWEAIGQQGDQNVSAGYQPSGSTIKLRLHNYLDSQNTKDPIDVTIYDDEVSFVITYTPAPSITLTVDSPSKIIPDVTPGQPQTATTIATVTAGSTGYSLKISDSVAGSDSALLHTDATTRIADFPGNITTPISWGSNIGLGICVYAADTSKESKWGEGTTETDSNNNYAGIPQTATEIHNVGSAVTNDNSSIGYKLDVPLNQKTGTYSGDITYTAIVNP